MYVLVILTALVHKDAIREKLNTLVDHHDIPNKNISSIDGEFNSYFYVDVPNRTIAENLTLHITKLAHIEGTYIKPKGSAPSN